MYLHIFDITLHGSAWLCHGRIFDGNLLHWEFKSHVCLFPPLCLILPLDPALAPNPTTAHF